MKSELSDYFLNKGHKPRTLGRMSTGRVRTHGRIAIIKMAPPDFVVRNKKRIPLLASGHAIIKIYISLGWSNPITLGNDVWICCYQSHCSWSFVFNSLCTICNIIDAFCKKGGCYIYYNELLICLHVQELRFTLDCIWEKSCHDISAIEMYFDLCYHTMI